MIIFYTSVNNINQSIYIYVYKVCIYIVFADKLEKRKIHIIHKYSVSIYKKYINICIFIHIYSTSIY